MSKPVKQLIRDELIKRFQGVTQLAVVGFTGVTANETNAIRARLRAKEMRMTVVKNAMARQAFAAVGLEGAKDLLDGPCAVVHGADSVVTVVRELLEIGRESPNLKIKAAFLEGAAFGPDRIDDLSRFPTRPEAIAQVVHCILSPAANLAGCVIGPAAQIAGILKAIEDKDPSGGGAPEASEAAA